MTPNHVDLIRTQIDALGASLAALGLCSDSPASNTGAVFDNGLFALRAYSWADGCDRAPEPVICEYCKGFPDEDGSIDTDWDIQHCTCPYDDPGCDDVKCSTCGPNFYHYPSGFSARWYKHSHRSFECDDIEPKKAVIMFKECLTSLKTS